MTVPGGRRLHVAFVITGLHGVAGGAERVLVDIANGLHRRHHRISVITYQDRMGPSFYPLDYGIARFDAKPAVAERDASARPLLGYARPPRHRAALNWTIRYGPKVVRLRRLLDVVRPDVAVGFLPSSFTYLELAALGTGVPTVASLHNVPDRELGGDPNRWDQNPVDIALRRRALRTSAANTVPLRSFVADLELAVRRKTYVLPNPIVAPCEHRPAAAHGDHRTVLAVGRLSPAKDHATLLAAWGQLEAAHPDWRLRILGEGPLRADLVAKIDRLGLMRASLEPPVSNIGEAYAAADLLVMSSRYEGFGLVTGEALACGRPVVGFADCPGTNELVIHGVNGLLVEPGSDRVAALADAMGALMADDRERHRLGEAAPATVRAFRPDEVLDGWERMLADVVGQRVPR